MYLMMNTSGVIQLSISWLIQITLLELTTPKLLDGYYLILSLH